MPRVSLAPSLHSLVTSAYRLLMASSFPLPSVLLCVSRSLPVMISVSVLLLRLHFFSTTFLLPYLSPWPSSTSVWSLSWFALLNIKSLALAQQSGPSVIEPQPCFPHAPLQKHVFSFSYYSLQAVSDQIAFVYTHMNPLYSTRSPQYCPPHGLQPNLQQMMSFPLLSLPFSFFSNSFFHLLFIKHLLCAQSFNIHYPFNPPC